MLKSRQRRSERKGSKIQRKMLSFNNLINEFAREYSIVNTLQIGDFLQKLHLQKCRYSRQPQDAQVVRR